MDEFDFIELAQLRRNSLISAVENLNIKQLDWRFNNNAITIGSSLLHIAGFEFLTALAMKYKVPPFSILSSEEWKTYKCGYLRECKSMPPIGFHSEYYINLLIENRKIIYELIKSSKYNFDEKYFYFYSTNDPFDVQSNGEFKDPKDHDKILSLSNKLILMRLPQHDNYHRGQITLLKYLQVSQ